jgi:hypothetical protein
MVQAVSALIMKENLEVSNWKRDKYSEPLPYLSVN